MIISTPSRIIHPMDLPPVRSVHHSENHDPIFSGLAIPRWHNLSIQVRLFEIDGVILTAFGILYFFKIFNERYSRYYDFIRAVLQLPLDPMLSLTAVF